MSHLRKQKGFTFVEMIVVFVIIVILALMLLPSFTTYFSQNRLKYASEGLFDDLLFARTSAIQQSTNVTVMFRSGSNWCYGMTTSSSCNCATANSCNLGQTTNTEYNNTSLSTTNLVTNGTDTSVTFDSVRASPTFSSATNGVIQISSTVTTSQQITITINQLGTATICSSGTVGGYGC